MDLDKVGKFIAENRKRQNLTQKDLGDLLGINPKTVSKWERGVNAPDIALLVEIAYHLHITVEELLAGEKINRHKFKIKNVFKYITSKSNKTLAIVIITFIIFVVLVTTGTIMYKKHSSNNINSDVYKIRTDSKDYSVSGFLILNDNDYSVNITEIKSLEEIKNRNTDIKFNNLDIDFISDEKIIYNYSYQDEENISFISALKNVNIEFNKKRNKNNKDIINAHNEIDIKYCTEEEECTLIQLNLSIEKDE